MVEFLKRIEMLAQQTAQRPQPAQQDGQAARRRRADPVAVQELVARVKKVLDERIHGMYPVKNALLAGMLSKADVEIFSPPGLGKTMLVRALLQAVGAKYAIKYITHDVTRADIIGPVIVRQRSDTLLVEYDVSRLIEANVLVYDEIYKAPPQVLIVLLSLLIRMLEVNGTLYTLNNLWFVIGISNIKELRERADDPVIEPLRDRFPVRLYIEEVPVSEYGNILDLVYGGGNTKDPRLREVPQVAAPEDVEVAQEYVESQLRQNYQYYKALVLRVVEAASRVRYVSPRQVVDLVRFVAGLDAVGVRGFVPKLQYLVSSLALLPEEKAKIAEEVQKSLNLQSYGQVEELVQQIERELGRKNYGLAKDLIARARRIAEQLPEEDRQTYLDLLQRYSSSIPP